MKWQLFIIGLFERTAHELENVVEGLTPEELNRQPAPGANTIGWLTWHLTRSYDRNISEVAGKEQLWTSDGWHARFDKPADPNETGYRHSPEDVATFKAPDSQTIIEYHRAVQERIKEYIRETLTETELERETTSPTLQTTFPVSRRLIGIINDGEQHVGQAAYIRGMIRGQGWLGR